MSQETNNKEVVAVVAGEEITQEEFNLFLQAVPREQQAYLAIRSSVSSVWISSSRCGCMRS